MYLLGYDIGSSSIKVALVEISTGKAKAVVQQPTSEMAIHAPQSGWAEQHPDTWWRHLCEATKQLLAEYQIDPHDIQAIGIAYQMHGLVMVDKDGDVIRPSIIWCDSRAVKIGDKAFSELGEDRCLGEVLNSPGNFTASKLAWVQANEPDSFTACQKIMLPGDYIAFKLSGDIQTTASGLSEGVLWDFKKNQPAKLILDYYNFDVDLIPELVDTVGQQAKVSALAAAQTGLASGTPISYRAGDQPNNAMALNVLNPGEVAATGGTSGVVYGVLDKPAYDLQSRVNGFAHVNHTAADPRIGILLCINGAGIQYGWLRKMISTGTPYAELELRAAKAGVGSDGLSVIPFGNGAERMLENKEIGAHFCNLQLNRHQDAHLIRATLEGIAYAFVYGIDILKNMGLDIKKIKVGNDNLFQSKIFAKAIATLTGAEILVINTTGAVGAALAAGVGIGKYRDFDEAMQHLAVIEKVTPDSDKEEHQKSYTRWNSQLERLMEAP